MANYLIDLMTWSYSRINTFLQCPYQFFLKYIDCAEEAPMFFSEYGSLIHDIFASYYSGRTSKQESLNDFLIRFPSEAIGAYPSEAIRRSYFEQGIESIKALSPISGCVISTEQPVRFSDDGKEFIGFIDMIYEDDNRALCILDHKSRSLKPRSNRKKKTKTDEELDQYLRQLYLYSIPFTNVFGKTPAFLEFNCYRTGVRIREPFCADALNETKRWAHDTIDAISRENDWRPNLDFWRCKYLCGFHDQCEYAQSVDWR